MVALGLPAQRAFHVRGDGRDEIPPCGGVEVLHGRDRRRIDVDLASEEEGGMGKARRHRTGDDLHIAEAGPRQLRSQGAKISPTPDAPRWRRITVSSVW